MLSFDKSSQLLPVVAQDRLTGTIRMVAYANEEAVRHTLETGRATFFSRSRGEIWEKGKTSGNVLSVSDVLVDCDADCLIYLVTPQGPSCHTGAPTCFFRRAVLEDGEIAVRGASSSEASSGEASSGEGSSVEGAEHRDEEVSATTLLERLERVLEARKNETATKSYTRSLYDGGAEKIGAKLREEADELSRAIAGEDASRVASEAADVLFHVMVALRSRGVAFGAVLEELDRRTGTSGHEEKRSRSK